MKNLLLGVALLIIGYVFQDSIGEMGGIYLYYAIMALGGIVSIRGFYLVLRDSDNSGIGGIMDELPIDEHVMFHTLARMAYADSHVHKSEVATIQRVFEEETGHYATEADVRVAARGDIYQTTSFETYLDKVEGKIDPAGKARIMKCLAHVLRSDGIVDPEEVEFFNTVSKHLKVTPDQLARL